MANPSSSSIEEAAEPEAERHGEMTQMMVADRKELAKYKDKYKRFWVSLVCSVFSFLMTFVLFLVAFLLRRTKPTLARECVDYTIWWIVIFVVNTPRHVWVYGCSPPRLPDPKPMVC